MNKLIAIILMCSTYLNAQTVCDSVSFSIIPSSTLTVVGTNNSTTAFTFMWGVCDSQVCYSSSGDTAYFAQVNLFDVVKVCYDLSPTWICNTCEYVVYIDGVWSVSSTTSINEVHINYDSGKIYDLLGRQLKYIPVNKMYIKSGKLYK